MDFCWVVRLQSQSRQWSFGQTRRWSAWGQRGEQPSEHRLMFVPPILDSCYTTGVTELNWLIKVSMDWRTTSFMANKMSTSAFRELWGNWKSKWGFFLYVNSCQGNPHHHHHHLRPSSKKCNHGYKRRLMLWWGSTTCMWPFEPLQRQAKCHKILELCFLWIQSKPINLSILTKDV